MVQELDYPFMIDGKKIVAIIPARAGSKRIPRKNRLKFRGQSLVEWSIKYSLFCNNIEKTVLSTDDKKIQDISKYYEISLHIRPKHLSNDTSSSFDLIKDIYFNYLNCNADIIILLQPTSPLREKNLLDKAFKLLHKENHWSSLIEVYPKVVFPAKIINGRWVPGLPEETRSQEIEPNYIPSGRLFLYNCKKTIEKNDPLGNRAVPLISDEWKNVNIDEESDLYKLSYVYEKLKNQYSYLLN
tara:strand:- start:2122 stop:2847 length:726 start_codon:yes stop_codon:yes gene_type:complete